MTVKRFRNCNDSDPSMSFCVGLHVHMIASNHAHPVALPLQVFSFLRLFFQAPYATRRMLRSPLKEVLRMVLGWH